MRDGWVVAWTRMDEERGAGTVKVNFRERNRGKGKVLETREESRLSPKVLL